MNANRDNAKDRWKRVPKDYFKKPDRLQRAKRNFSALALFLAVGWLAFGFDWTGTRGSTTDWNSLRANHGELAKVHTAWERKCDACHVPFEPIDGRALLASTSTPSARSSDKLCMTCHAGPEHHAAVLETEVRSCAECHRDHRGREASLVRLGDVECTRCHEDLSKHTTRDRKQPGTRDYSNKVVGFNSEDHPNFHPIAAPPGKEKPKDPSRLKFNHKLHMSKGLVENPGETEYTLDRIPIASGRNRYVGDEKGVVQLDCASCHVLDASDLPSGSSGSPSRSAGQYYLPVKYETECRACHTLSFDPALPADPKSPRLEAPHGVQPAEVVAFLEGTYANQAFKADPSFLKTFNPGSPIPGKSPVDEAVRKRYDTAVDKARNVLLRDEKANCLECHHIDKGDDKGVPDKVAATNVPEIWFTHAVFDHSAHRAVSCRDCHARAYALEKDASSVNTDVILPGIDNCVKCHAPSSRGGGWLSRSSATDTGGVAFDCTECHRYHNGDHSQQGLGATAQRASHERTIDQFLLGTGGHEKATARRAAGP